MSKFIKTFVFYFLDALRMKPRLRSISLLKYDSVFSSSKIGGAYDANMDGIWLFFFESNRGLTPDEFLKSCSCPVLPTELLVCLE